LDTVSVPEKFKLTVEFFSKSGVYLGNLTGYKPSLYINQEKYSTSTILYLLVILLEVKYL